MKIEELIPIFVDQIPIELEEGKLYISYSFKCSSHLCACGCKQETYLPFPYISKDNTNRGWLHNIVNDIVTITPSIGNWSGESSYHAHYFITNNKIVWV